MRQYFYILLFLLLTGCIVINPDNYTSLDGAQKKELRYLPKQGSKSYRTAIREIEARHIRDSVSSYQYTWVILGDNQCTMYSPTYHEWIQNIIQIRQTQKINTFFVFNYYNWDYIKQFQADCLPTQTGYILSNARYGNNAEKKLKRFINDLSPDAKISTKEGYPLHLLLDSEGKVIFSGGEGYGNDTTRCRNRIRTFITNLRR